jgi:hypothetical protein
VAFAQVPADPTNPNEAVAVVGPSGDLVYFEKQDNCQLWIDFHLTA